MPPPTISTTPVVCCLCGADESDVVGRGRDFEYDTCANDFTFVRCRRCGHHYLSPRPTPAEMATIYPSCYGNYSNSRTPSLPFRVKNFLEGRTLRRLAARLPAGFSVLDVGCGDGRLLDNVRAHCPRVGRLEGVEISPVAAAAAVGKGYPVHVGTLADHPGSAETFDLVFLIQVIEHVPDPRADVRRILRLLAPGGIAVFETPSVRCLDFRLFRRRYWGGYHFPRHFNLFTPEGFTRLLRDEGLEVESVLPKLQPVHWVWSLHHVFREWGLPEWWVRQFHIRNAATMAVGTLLDALQFLPLRRSSNMQVIARKPVATAT